MSIELGIDAAMRRASASTNGSPATMRRVSLGATGWTRIRDLLLDQLFRLLLTIATAVPTAERSVQMSATSEGHWTVNN
jgi:hypothetical protein